MVWGLGVYEAAHKGSYLSTIWIIWIKAIETWE